MRNRNRLLPIFLLAGAIFVNWPGLAQARISGEAFVASPAANAFKAGDFNGALAGFEAMLTEHPDDPLILRYIGISHDRLGDFAAARKAYERSLAIEPDSVSTRYFLAVTEYKLGDNDAARKDFQSVTDVAPASDYGRSATEFLAAIGTAPAPEPTRLSGFFQLGFQGDSNVNAGPGGSANRNEAFSEYLGIQYALVETNALKVNLKGSGYFTQYPDPVANDYDLMQGSVGLDTSYVTAMGGVPMMPGIAYNYSKTWLRGNSYGGNHSVVASLGFGLGSNAMATAKYSWSMADLTDDGTAPATTSRDGVSQSAGLSTNIFFANRKAALTLGYDYGWANTEGDNGDTASHSGSAGLWGRLPWEIDGQLSYGMSRTDYTSYRGPLPRESTTRSINLSLARNITEKIKASVAVSNVAEESPDYPDMSYDRTIYSFSLGYQF